MADEDDGRSLSLSRGGMPSALALVTTIAGSTTGPAPSSLLGGGSVTSSPPRLCDGSGSSLVSPSVAAGGLSVPIISCWKSRSARTVAWSSTSSSPSSALVGPMMGEGWSGDDKADDSSAGALVAVICGMMLGCVDFASALTPSLGYSIVLWFGERAEKKN